MSEPTLLIVPGGYGDAAEHRKLAEAIGMRVVGASSVAADPAGGDYAAYSFLPHITDGGFEGALTALIAREGVGRIHATHYAVWHHLNQLLPKVAPGVSLSLGRTNFDLEKDYAALRRTVAEAPRFDDLPPARRPDLIPVETAGMIRAALAVPGESYGDKLFALIQAMRRAPIGDVVEVGSLFGRTAALLAMLADRYAIGAVLCVDPWSRDEIDQGAAAAALLEPSLAYDWDAWRLIFEINVAPFARGRLNYLKAASVAGAAIYAAQHEATTEAFGTTRYSGRIALLHIDANHGYDHVKADAEAWIPHMAPGGIIVFDDYDWDWGDGPRRVADAFLRAESARVKASFVAGGAMFVMLKS